MKHNLLTALLLGLLFGVGCSDYRLTGLPDEMGLSYFKDCTTVIGERYGYIDHTFGAVMVHDGCEQDDDPSAYLLIEHEFEEMDVKWTTAQYTTENNDVITVDAVQYSLDLWYNPVDIELEIVPYQNQTALGIHEFWVDCPDDDSQECPVEYVGGIGPEDLE